MKLVNLNNQSSIAKLDVLLCNYMNIGEQIKKIRTAKNLSQKEVALALEMDQAQFSRIENGKTDPAFSTIEKVARALGVGLAELVNADDIFAEVNSYDKSVIEKMALVDQLEEKEKSAFFSILDALVSKKRLKDSLSNALNALNLA
jgi:transcriptional regulator with XRE-family HTH domain